MENERLIETAKKILALPEVNHSINMRKFQSGAALKEENLEQIKKQPNKCGTAFCIAGWLALYDNFPIKHRTHNPKSYDEPFNFCYVSYSEELTGFDTEDLQWKFLFDDFWPNSLKGAKERAQYVVDNNGEIPDVDCWVEAYGYTDECRLPD